MRHHRVAAALVAPVLGASLMLAGGTAADAATHATHTAVAPASAGTPSHDAVPAKKRTITLLFKAFGAKSFKFTGTVTPEGEKTTVILLRSNTKTGHYSKVHTTKTDGQGSFTFGGLTKTGYYVARVNSSGGYKTSISKVEHIFRR